MSEGPGRRSERCVCGVTITARDATWEAVADAVALHNAGPAHTAWRLGMRLIRDRDTWSRDALGVSRVVG